MRDNQRINEGDSELQKSTAQRYYRAMCHFVFGTTADQELLWESQDVFTINDLVPVANTSTRTHKCLLSLVVDTKACVTVTYVYGVSSPK